VLLSAAGLFLALRGVDWEALGSALQTVHLGWLLAAVVAEILAVWINAIRWRWLFWPHHSPRTRRLFGILNVAQLANTVLPGRLGLPLRAVLVGGGGQISRVTALTTLAVEKVLEGATLLPIGAVLLLVLDLPDWLRASTILSGCLLLGLLLAFGGGLRWKEPFLAWISRWSTGRLYSIAHSLLAGLDSLRSTRARWRLWIWSLVYWAAVATVNGFAIQAAGLDVSPIAVLVLLFVLQIGVRLPSFPGNLGVFDYLGVVSLAIFGIEKTPALGVTLLLHLVFYLPPSLLGVGYLLWTNTRLCELRQAALPFQES
jgi:hypothetical protein